MFAMTLVATECRGDEVAFFSLVTDVVVPKRLWETTPSRTAAENIPRYHGLTAASGQTARIPTKVISLVGRDVINRDPTRPARNLTPSGASLALSAPRSGLEQSCKR